RRPGSPWPRSHRGRRRRCTPRQLGWTRSHLRLGPVPRSSQAVTPKGDALYRPRTIRRTELATSATTPIVETNTHATITITSATSGPAAPGGAGCSSDDAGISACTASMPPVNMFLAAFLLRERRCGTSRKPRARHERVHTVRVHAVDSLLGVLEGRGRRDERLGGVPDGSAVGPGADPALLLRPVRLAHLREAAAARRPARGRRRLTRPLQTRR